MTINYKQSKVGKKCKICGNEERWIKTHKCVICRPTGYYQPKRQRQTRNSLIEQLTTKKYVDPDRRHRYWLYTNFGKFATDQDEISQLRDQRDYITRLTGVNHVLDHIIPVTTDDDIVCGLTVSWNLQIISVKENSNKRDAFDPFTKSRQIPK